MCEDNEVIMLDDSFQFNYMQDQGPIIISDSEEDGDQKASRHLDHQVIESSFLSLPSTSYFSANASSVDILENSQGDLSKLNEKSTKMYACTTPRKRIPERLQNSGCFVPDSDDEDAPRFVSKENDMSLCVDDSLASILSFNNLDSFADVSMTSLSNSIDSSFSFISPKASPNSSVEISCVSLTDIAKKESNNSIPYVEESKPNVSNSSTLGFKSGKDHSCSDYNSSVTSVCDNNNAPDISSGCVQSLDRRAHSLDRSVHSLDKTRKSNDSSYDSQKEASPCLTEKQRCLQTISGKKYVSNSSTLGFKSGKDHSGSDYNSSVTSVCDNNNAPDLSSGCVQSLDESAHSLGKTRKSNDSSYDSQKEASPCLTEKQRCSQKISGLEDSIMKKKLVLKCVDLATLPDRGVRLQLTITSMEKELKQLKLKFNNIPDDGKPQAMDDSLDNGSDSSIIVEHVVQPPVLSVKDVNVGNKPTGNSSCKNTFAMIRGMDSVTMDSLKNLHDSLKTCPADTVMADDPQALKIALMPHQRHGLAWMLWREQQLPSGGILADDMGLGKTLSMISLILKHKELVRDEKIEELDGNFRGGTLIVCPTSLLGQWKNEVERRCKQSSLSICVHHGTDRSTGIKSMKRHDIVITTYGIVMRECISIQKKISSKKEDGPLHVLEWTRIILDEAHVVRNHKSQTSQAVCCLKGKYRWALTGTPIHNKELDLFALIVFLRCSPFDKYLTWRRWVDNKTAAGAQRMNMLMKSLMLRRTKDQLQSGGNLICLPERKLHHIKIDLESSEQAVYDQILILSRNLFAQFMDQHAARMENKLLGDEPGSQVACPTGKNDMFSSGISEIWANPSIPGSALAAMKAIPDDRVVKSHHLLVLLLRLRQICCHPGLIQSMLEDEDYKTDGIVDDSGLDVDLISHLNSINLLDRDVDKDENDKCEAQIEKNPLTMKNPVFRLNRPSTKINALFNCLKENVLDGQDKAVVVSQWTSVLNLIGDHLKRNGTKYYMLNGSVPLKTRTDIVENFNNNLRGPKVLLLSLKAGGVGLNLVGGNHLLLVDLHWNPQLEAQACDRIYRVGQKKGVHIYRFVCKHTVEEKIHALQEKKLTLAENVLTGAKNPQSNKLTLEDLKLLFTSSPPS